MKNLKKFSNLDKPPYDAYLNWSISPDCNFDCDYCFNHPNEKKPVTIKPINIKKVIKTLKKTNKTYFIAFSGGEPFLIPNFIELCKSLAKDHYIGIVTNLSCTTKIKKFIKQVPAEKVKNIHASCHVSEYKKRGINDDFFIKNYNLLKKHKFNINASYVVYPPLLPQFEKDISYYRSRGIGIYSRFFIGEYRGKHYPKSYADEEKKKILKYHHFGNKEIVHLKGTLCNAGYNAAAINSNGNIFACYSVPLKLGNIFKKIKFNRQLLRCPVESCSCPLKIYEPYLFDHAHKTATAYSPLQQKFLLTKMRRCRKIMANNLRFFPKLKKLFLYVINTPDRLLGKFGIFLKKRNPDLYHKLKRVEKLFISAKLIQCCSKIFI